MKQKMIEAHIQVAETYAQLSTAERLKVGAIVVKDSRVISIGYNGTPSGWDNVCEDKDFKTKPEVLHAETNAIAKLARSPESGLDSSMFITHAPCLDCAKLIYQAGIKEVYFRAPYRNEDGINFLKRSNVKIRQV